MQSRRRFETGWRSCSSRSMECRVRRGIRGGMAIDSVQLRMRDGRERRDGREMGAARGRYCGRWMQRKCCNCNRLGERLPQRMNVSANVLALALGVRHGPYPSLDGTIPALDLWAAPA